MTSSTSGRNASQRNKEEATDLVWPCYKNGRKTTATKSNARPYRRDSECRKTAKKMDRSHQRWHCRSGTKYQNSPDSAKYRRRWRHLVTNSSSPMADRRVEKRRQDMNGWAICCRATSQSAATTEIVKHCQSQATWTVLPHMSRPCTFNPITPQYTMTTEFIPT